VNSITIGRNASCDLVLDSASVSRVHARLELAASGKLCVLDDDSRNGSFLKRNDAWIQFKKVTLCIGDRIRFGDLEMALEQLTAMFPNPGSVRLEPRHFSLRDGEAFKPGTDNGLVLKKPRRNPETGLIEENPS